MTRNTYSSDSLGDSSSDGNGAASTRIATSTVSRSVTRASRAGAGGNLNNSDSLCLGGVEGVGSGLGGVLGRLGLVITNLAGLSDAGLRSSTSLGLCQSQLSIPNTIYQMLHTAVTVCSRV